MATRYDFVDGQLVEAEEGAVVLFSEHAVEVADFARAATTLAKRITDLEDEVRALNPAE